MENFGATAVRKNYCLKALMGQSRITGKKHYFYAADERSSGDCGKDAKHFQKKKSLLSRLFSKFKQGGAS